MAKYIYQFTDWPQLFWDEDIISPILVKVRHNQGRILGRMEGLGFSLQAEASLENLTLDVLKSSEIEGEILNPDQVRSSIARRLGMDIAGLVPADRNVEGVVEMMLDATQNYADMLTEERLFSWHAALFPTGRSGMHKIVVGNWRKNTKDDPMQVVSGPMGKERVHFHAPDSDIISEEMKKFLSWFNGESQVDPVLKAAVAHLWFVTLHPFDDGNGRIARTITDMQLSRAEKTQHRFYSMSTEIRRQRADYYKILESTQKDTLDITAWIEWFLNCLEHALISTNETLAGILRKARFWEKHAAINLNSRQRLLLNKMLDGFEGKLTSSKWAKIAKCSQDTAGRDIQDLIEKNILVKEPSGGRSTSYLIKEISD